MKTKIICKFFAVGLGLLLIFTSILFFLNPISAKALTGTSITNGTFTNETECFAFRTDNSESMDINFVINGYPNAGSYTLTLEVQTNFDNVYFNMSPANPSGSSLSVLLKNDYNKNTYSINLTETMLNSFTLRFTGVGTFANILNVAYSNTTTVYFDFTSPNIEIYENYIDDIYQSGYESGMSSSEIGSLQNGWFSLATLESVYIYYDDSTHSDIKLDFVQYGIGFDSIMEYVGNYLRSINGGQLPLNTQLSITLLVKPFKWVNGVLSTVSRYGTFNGISLIGESGEMNNARYPNATGETDVYSINAYDSGGNIININSPIEKMTFNFSQITTGITFLMYQQGQFEAGEASGYNDGYQAGLEVGKEQASQESYENGYNSGYNKGYNQATSDSESLWGYIKAIGEVPFIFVGSWLNFELMGVNMRDFVTAILSTCLVIAVVKLLI